MKEIYEQLETTGFIVVHALIALTKIMERPQFRPEEQKEINEKESMNIDNDLEKYFNYKE